ncbi:extensin-like [Asterias rubens]|uniref:extensin-like n=1 Tax=Asterias rubens TaxID=7604 RepID=UPI001455270B|nr:extensin-like [Asterias rubens]
MNPNYPPQAYSAGRPNGAPPGYGGQPNPAIPAQPPPIGFNPALYQHPSQTPAYSSQSPYASHVSLAPSPAQYRYQQPPPIYSSAPAYLTQAQAVSAMSYSSPGAYTYAPGQPTYIQQPAQPVSNLTVVQPGRNVYVPNATPSHQSSYDAATLAGLGFVAGAALGSGHHHYGHHGYHGHHHGFGSHHNHHGFGHH